MRSNRKLEVRRELLTELVTDELRVIGAGNEEGTRGGICRTVAAATIIVVAVSLATLCVCADGEA